METALIGLIGVILGGTLTGILNLRLERAKRRHQAHAVGVLIDSELHRAQDTIADALDRGTKSLSETLAIPTTYWRQRAEALAVDMEPATWVQVENAYRALERLNQPDTVHDEQTLRAAGHDAHVAQMSVAKTLKKVVHGVADTRLRPRLIGLSAVSNVVLVVLVMLVVTRDDITSTTVAAQLEYELEAGSPVPMDYIVDCDPDKDDWLCTIEKTTKEPIACPASFAITAVPCSDRTEERVQVMNTTSRDTLRVVPTAADFAAKFGVDHRSIERPRKSLLRSMWCKVTTYWCDEVAPYAW